MLEGLRLGPGSPFADPRATFPPTHTHTEQQQERLDPSFAGPQL